MSMMFKTILLWTHSPFVLESVHDPVFEPNHVASDASCSSSQIITQILSTNISPPPTLLLDSVILKEVCQNIFEDLTKLVEARNHVIPSNIYEEQWTSLRERVDYVMFEMKKLSQEAYNQTLHNWFKDIARSMKEMELNMNPVERRLYISYTPIYMDASSIITSSVQSEDHNLSWLTKIVIHSDAPILEKLKRDSEQEQRVKQLENELFEQKLMYANLKRNMEAHNLEFKFREEAHLKGYNELKEAMQKQSDTMTNMMSQMMDMMKNQAKP